MLTLLFYIINTSLIGSIIYNILLDLLYYKNCNNRYFLLNKGFYFGLIYGYLLYKHNITLIK
jgi:hypothetical protein